MNKYEKYPKATKEYQKRREEELFYVRQYIIDRMKKDIDCNQIKGELLIKGYEETLINSTIEELKDGQKDTYQKKEEYPEETAKKKNIINRFFPKVKFELKPDKVEQPIIIKEEDANPVFKPIDKEVITHTGGLVSKIDELNEKVDAMVQINKEQVHKKFALPNKIKSQLKKLAEKNKVLVLLLRRNRSIEPMITDVKNGFVIINSVPRNCSLDFVFLWKGQNLPCMVVKEWDLEPVGTKDYYEAVKANRIADPMPTAIRMLEELTHMEKGGMQISPKVWVFIGLGAIALIWVIFGGGF